MRPSVSVVAMRPLAKAKALPLTVVASRLAEPASQWAGPVSRLAALMLQSAGLVLALEVSASPLRAWVSSSAVSVLPLGGLMLRSAVARSR